MMGGVSGSKTPVLPQTEGAKELVRAVRAGVPYAAGKLGTSEFTILVSFLKNREHPYSKIALRHISVNAGLFPHTKASVNAWAEHMLAEVLPTLDLAVNWNPAGQLYEHYFLCQYASKAKQTVLRALEPYYEDIPEDRYTLALPAAAKVAVVSPFSESVEKQKMRLQDVWPAAAGRQIWNSDTEIVPIRTGYNPVFGGTGWPTGVSTWQEAVQYCVDAVVASGATIALVGCGALSLPVVAALKRAGKIAIHTGGATQILFGIQGRRWDSHSVISKFYSDAWIRPADSEIPSYSETIEGGCYW